MEELFQVRFGEPSIAKLSNSGIRVIKDRVLLAPGFWNGRNYTPEEIRLAYERTNWEDKDVISLIADHRDDDAKGRPLTIRDWLGYVSNQRLREDGYVIGDLNICNPTLATQLIDGEAPFGISPFVYGKFDKLTNTQRDFVFKNFAVVVEPACKEAYINAYLSDDKLNKKLDELSPEERINISLNLEEVKLEETCTTDIKGSKVESNGLQPIKTKKKKSQSSNKDVLKELKGGSKKMSEEVEKQEVTTESEEEKVDEVSEPVEEKKEVVEEKMEDSESEEEEESEEKLMEQLAKIAEKLANKKKLTPEQAKMQKLESEIVSLQKEVKKLQEEKKGEPLKEKEGSEKLSAKPKTRGATIQTEEGFKMFAKPIGKGSIELAKMLGY